MNTVLKIGYIGTNYNGFNKQKLTNLTIECILENALHKIYGYNIHMINSSRTDSGVHAISQMVQYRCNNEIPINKIPYILNNILPWDIRVYSSFITNDDFNVRYDCLFKVYHYLIDNNKRPLLEFLPLSYHCPIYLNFENMFYSIRFLKGKHNFKAFCTKKTNTKNFIRTIYMITLERKERGMLILKITGNGFLYNMVRIIVGTMIDVGRGHLDNKIFLKALNSQERRFLGKISPSKGLLLKKIVYKKGILPIS